MTTLLPDVTVCVADSAMPQLAARALSHCARLCAFGDAVLFTDAKLTRPEFRTESIPALASRAAYSRFILKDLHRFVRTEFCLVIQWDGYVLDASRWQDSYRCFDYMGARWLSHPRGQNVGNGGFSWRSKRLLEATASPAFTIVADFPEDELIGRVHRSWLEAECGVRFADESAADTFSYERAPPDSPTFGFHGVFNMWRHVADAEMVDRSRHFAPHLCRSREYFELLMNYALQRKFPVAQALYARLRTCVASAEFEILSRRFLPAELLGKCRRVFAGLESELAFGAPAEAGEPGETGDGQP